MADHMELDRLATAEARLAYQCFKVRYQGDAHVQVYGQVRGLCSIANKSVHYSPYTTFVQSSGVGKTSLAGKSSSAYPPRTAFLADRLATACTELEAVLYLKAWLVVLAKAVAQGVAAVAWKEQQLGSSDIAKAVRDEWEALIAATPAKAYAEHLRGRDSANVSLLGDDMENVDKLLGRGAGLPRVLFVFDEARGLLHLGSETAAPSTSPFCQVRRALRAFFRRRTFFALMLDTSAKVATSLLPRKSDEDSSRALKIGIGLLPPIIYLPTLQLNVPKPGLRLEEYVRPATWMKYGRPMWAARMAVEGEGEDMLSGNLLVFATQKLMGDFCDEFSSNGTMTEGQAVALLSAAAGVQICPRSPLAEKLAASHMHYVLRVTLDRSRVYVSLPAEPILSEAAANLLQNEQVKQKALMHMEAACRAGYVTGGPRGEFVAKFILTAAVWSFLESMSGNWYLQPISVEDFLRQLLGASKSAFAKVEPKLPEGGIVFFHSFVAVGEVPGPGMLAKCFAAGHAIMYQADDTVPGADLIVPVWTPSGKMTCMIVSVWLEALSLGTVRSEVTRVEVDAGLPTVAVLMSLREPAVASPMGWLFWDQADRLYVQLTCYGIDGNYDYLSGEVKELLKAILITMPDLLEGASNQEKQWIKEMLPYQYLPAPDSFPVHPSSS